MAIDAFKNAKCFVKLSKVCGFYANYQKKVRVLIICVRGEEDET